MDQPSDRMTRRTATALLIGGPLALGHGAAAQTAPIHWKDWLRQRIRAVPLGTRESRADLIWAEGYRIPGGVRIEAVVSLIWPPGLRQRKFQAENVVAEGALKAMRADIEDHLISLTHRN